MTPASSNWSMSSVTTWGNKKLPNCSKNYPGIGRCSCFFHSDVYKIAQNSHQMFGLLLQAKILKWKIAQSCHTVNEAKYCQYPFSEFPANPLARGCATTTTRSRVLASSTTSASSATARPSSNPAKNSPLSSSSLSYSSDIRQRILR